MKPVRMLPPLYRTLYRTCAVLALFFLAACAREGVPAPKVDMRKDANRTFSTDVPPKESARKQAQKEPAVLLKTVKIGLLVPLSGEAAEMGAALLDAATLALMDKYVHTQADALKVKVILVPKDTQGTPQGAAAAAQYVLDAGAQLIVGPLFAQNVKTVAPLAKRYSVNVLSLSNNPDVAGDGVFVFGFMVDQQVKRIINYALNRNVARIALLAANTPYGISVQQSATEILAESGLSLAQTLLYNPVTNAAPEMEKLTKEHGYTPYQAVLLPEGGQKLPMIVSTLSERGMAMPQVQYLGTGVWDDPAVLRSGVLTGGWFASSSPERFAAYERRFRDYFGYAPPRLSALSYDALALAASLAMSGHGANFSVDAITDPVGYNGPVNGIFRCHSNGICERGLAVLEATREGAKVIDPAPTAFSIE